VDITTTPAWSAALKSAAAISQTTLKDLFAQDLSRVETLSVEVQLGEDTMLVDFSKQNVDQHAVQCLIAVAEQAGVEQKRNDMFEGVSINGTEQQPALHTALRAPSETSVNVNGIDVMEEVLRVRAAMKPISTVPKALDTIDVATGESAKAINQRSDVCAVPAAGVVAEAMVALVLAEAVLEKFGGDSVTETRRNFTSYMQNLNFS